MSMKHDARMQDIKDNDPDRLANPEHERAISREERAREKARAIMDDKFMVLDIGTFEHDWLVGAIAKALLEWEAAVITAIEAEALRWRDTNEAAQRDADPGAMHDRFEGAKNEMHSFAGWVRARMEKGS